MIPEDKKKSIEDAVKKSRPFPIKGVMFNLD